MFVDTMHYAQQLITLPYAHALKKRPETHLMNAKLYENLLIHATHLLVHQTEFAEK